MSGTIIEAGLAHAPVLALLHQAAFPAEPWDTQAFLSLLMQPGMAAWLDERGGFLVLRVVADEAEIITCGAVIPRIGIAAGLLGQALAFARRQNVNIIHLEVAESNAPARALYESVGFTMTGRRKAYYPDGADALTMSLHVK